MRGHRRPSTVDVARATAVTALAVAQPLATQIARWTGRGAPETARARATEGPVTPAAGAFAIWGPLFAGSLGYAAADVRAARAGDRSVRAAGWWVAAASAGNIAWSVNSQFRDLDEVSVALIAGSAAAATTAVALAERQRDGSPAARDLTRLVAPLAGWLAVATAANVENTATLRSGRPPARVARRRAGRLVTAAAVAAGAVNAGLLRGNPAHAAAVCWGLGGVAVKAARDRDPVLVATAGAGVAAQLAAVVLARRAVRRRG